MIAWRTPWWGHFGRRIARDTAGHVTLVIAAGLTLFIAVDFVEKGNLAGPGEMADVLELELYSLPMIFLRILAFAGLMGGASAVGGWVRRREVVAMLAAGAHPLTVLKPVLLIGMGSALICAILTEWVAPPAYTRVSDLRRKLGLTKHLEPTGQGRWFKGHDRLYRVAHLSDPEGRALDGVLMLRIEDGRLRERWDIERLEYRPEGWTAYQVLHRTLTATVVKTHTTDLYSLSLTETPEDFVRSVGAPEQLHFRALVDAVQARAQLGQETALHRWALYRRIAYPILVAMGLVLGAGIALRLGRHPALFTTLGTSATAGFGLWLLDEIGLALTTSQAISPQGGVLLGPLGLGGLGLWIWRRILARGIQD